MIKSNKISFICLAVSALIGNVFLMVSFTGNSANDILGLILAMLAAAATVLSAKCFCETRFFKLIKNKSIVFGAEIILTLLLLATIIIFTLFSFSRFAAEVMLSVTSIFLPFVSVFIIALFLGLSEKKVIFKFSVIILPIVFAIFVLMFAYSVRFMNIKYLALYKEADSGLLSAFLPLYLNLTSSSVPLLIIGKREKKRIFTYSFVILFLVVGIGFITILGMFGSELASTIKYPYLSAVSTAAMGEIFSRFDGFFYFSVFFTVIIKIGLCVYSFKEIFSKFLNFTIEK